MDGMVQLTPGALFSKVPRHGVVFPKVFIHDAGIIGLHVMYGLSFFFFFLRISFVAFYLFFLFFFFLFFSWLCHRGRQPLESLKKQNEK